VTTFVVEDTCMLTAEIADARGELHTYSLVAVPPGGDRWACVVSRLTGEHEREYRVGLDNESQWRCSCPDMIYRNRAHRSRLRGAPCKHLDVIAPLYAALCRLFERGEATDDQAP
jgi:hypothetical protein